MCEDSGFDYKRIEEIVEECRKIPEFEQIDRYLVWVMAVDYWIKEEQNNNNNNEMRNLVINI